MTLTEPPPPEKRNGLLLVIGAFKLLKAMILLAAAYGLHHLRLSPDVDETLTTWVKVVHFDPGSFYMHRLISGATGIPPEKLHHAGIGLFVYGALFGLEGIGLLLRKRWAEYVVIVTTSLLLPLEVIELLHPHRRAIKAAIFVANLAILAYLIWNLYRTRDQHEGTAGQPLPDAPGPGANAESAA